MAELGSICAQELSGDYVSRVQSLCRLCLFQTKELDLQADSYLPDKKWIGILDSVTNYSYSENNRKEYPQGICEECSSKLVLFYKFKQKVAISYSTLEIIFKNNQESIEKIAKNAENLKDMYVEHLVDDFIEEVPLSEDESVDGIVKYGENVYGIRKVQDDIIYNENEYNSQEYVTDIESNICDANEKNVCYLEVAEEEDKLFNDNTSNFDEEQELVFNYALDESETSNFIDATAADSTKKRKVKNIQCEICGAKFTRNSSLRQHDTVHSLEKNFECKLCNKKFTRRAHVSTHMLIHSNIRPHSCEVCGRAFTKSGDLKRHQKIHSEVYDFICLICNKEFKRKEYLTAHINAHYGVKPHKCKYCEKRYQSLSGLLKHTKNVHSYKEN